jgi:glycosyltransferase involved in cell wall biosynthesis
MLRAEADKSNEVFVVGRELPRLSDPRVSVVICNYNYDRYLEQALQSVVAQTRACEIIVVDDGSTDGSRAILERWRDRVTVVLQDNAGQRAAYNTGLSRCSGEVVLFLDSDDALEPQAVEQVARAFDHGVAKVHFRLRLVDEQGALLAASVPSYVVNGEVASKLMRHGVLYISSPGSGNAYRKSVLDMLFPLPLDPTDRHGADFFAIYGAALFGEVRGIEACLGRYRIQADSGATEALVFGNAAQRAVEPQRSNRRSKLFQSWISDRTAGALRPPELLGDFSLSKTLFVRAIFATGYLDGVRAGARELPRLLQRLWLSDSYSPPVKAGLSGWALAVLVAPRALGRELARKVTNPASRSARPA